MCFQGLNFNIQRSTPKPSVSDPPTPTTLQSFKFPSSSTTTSTTATKAKPPRISIATKFPSPGTSTATSTDQGLNTSQLQAAVQQAAMVIAGKMLASYGQATSSTASVSSTTAKQVASIAGLLNIPQLVSAALKSVPPATSDASGRATLRALESLAEGSQDTASPLGQMVSPDVALQGLFAAQTVPSRNKSKLISSSTAGSKTTSTASPGPGKKMNIDKEHEQAIQKLQFHDFPLTTVSLTSSTAIGTITKAKILKDLEKGNMSGLPLTTLSKPAAAPVSSHSKPEALTTYTTASTRSTQGPILTGSVSASTGSSAGPPSLRKVNLIDTIAGPKTDTKLASVSLTKTTFSSLGKSLMSTQLTPNTSVTGHSLQTSQSYTKSSGSSTFGKRAAQFTALGGKPVSTTTKIGATLHSFTTAPTTVAVSVKYPSEKASNSKGHVPHVQLARVKLPMGRGGQPGDKSSKAPFTGRASPVTFKMDPSGAVRKSVNQPSAFKPALVAKVISVSKPAPKETSSPIIFAKVTSVRNSTAVTASKTTSPQAEVTPSQKTDVVVTETSKTSSTPTSKDMGVVSAGPESKLGEQQVCTLSTSSKTASGDAVAKRRSSHEPSSPSSTTPSPKTVGAGSDPDSDGKGTQGLSSSAYMSTRTRRVRTPRQYSDYTE